MVLELGGGDRPADVIPLLGVSLLLRRRVQRLCQEGRVLGRWNDEEREEWMDGRMDEGDEGG